MESSEVLSKSIFDIIEERSETPNIFAWSDNVTLFNKHPDIFLFEGNLMTVQKDPYKLRTRRYVLTLNALIKYKVAFSFNKSSLEIKSFVSKGSFEA